jgi:hypothetical protein
LIKKRVVAGMSYAKAARKEIGRPRRVFYRQKALELRQ